MVRQNQVDARDVPVSPCLETSLVDLETALIQFQSYFGDPVETLESTLSNDPMTPILSSDIFSQPAHS